MAGSKLSKDERIGKALTTIVEREKNFRKKDFSLLTRRYCSNCGSVGADWYNDEFDEHVEDGEGEKFYEYLCDRCYDALNTGAAHGW